MGAIRDLGDYRRYAVYWAPETGSPLARFGAAWFGWDPEARREAERAEFDLPCAAGPLTSRARRYGFHATLRNPFRLRASCPAEALDDALARFAAATPAVAGPPLRLDDHLGFLSLRPQGPAPALDRLAEACIRAVHGFALPPDRSELSRRRAGGLSPREERLLARWGYPYVMEAFRFHVTLTGPLQRELAESVAIALGPRLAPLLEPEFRIRSLCLFADPGDGPFHLVRRYALAAPRWAG